MSRNRGKTPASLPCRAAGTSRNRRGDAAFDDPPASREKRRGLLPRKPCDFRRSRTYAADAPAGERIGFAPLLFSMEKRPRSIVIVQRGGRRTPCIPAPRSSPALSPKRKCERNFPRKGEAAETGRNDGPPPAKRPAAVRVSGASLRPAGTERMPRFSVAEPKAPPIRDIFRPKATSLEYFP